MLAAWATLKGEKDSSLTLKSFKSSREDRHIKKKNKKKLLKYGSLTWSTEWRDDQGRFPQRSSGDGLGKMRMGLERCVKACKEGAREARRGWGVERRASDLG